MSLSEVSNLFSKLAKAQVPAVIITGGEPLLKRDLVVACIEQCKINGISCSINSNLVPLNSDLLENMIRAGKFSILTSIASCEEGVHDYLMSNPGAFKKTVSATELLAQNNIGFSVNMVVTKINAHQVYETGLFAHKLGAKMFAATKASPPLGCVDYSMVQPSKKQVKDSLDDLLRIHESTGMDVGILECYPLCFFGDIDKYSRFTKRRCLAGISSAAIGPEGGIRPCSHSDRIYGNIFNEELETVYSKMKEWRTGELLPETCRSCAHISRCSGGCRCEAEYADQICGLDPYASEESDVNNLPQNLTNDLSSTATMYIPNDIKFREESFGYVVYRGGRSALLDHEAGQFLQHHLDSNVKIEEVLKKYPQEIDGLKFIFARLIEKKIIHCLSW